MLRPLRKPRLKKCRICRQLFSPKVGLQVVCGLGCSVEYARRQEQKRAARARRARRRENRAAKELLKTAPQLTKEAQTAFNAFIRLRDEDQPCISCGKPPIVGQGAHGGHWDAGHYMSVGAHPELRFCEDNCHKQCKACNSARPDRRRKAFVHPVERQLSVRAAYREGLIKRRDLHIVEWLEGPHESINLTRDDLRKTRDFYRHKVKELRRCRKEQ